MTTDTLSDYLLIGVLVTAIGVLWLTTRRSTSADALVPPRPKLNTEPRRPRVIVKNEEREAEIEAKRVQERAEKGLD